jgi:RNA polymerase sigma-70 factor (ECF subfamily)
VSTQAAAHLNSESTLIAQARNGDVNAFAVLYETHRPRIVAVCLRMTKDMAEAEDLTQDAFIYVFRKFSSFRGDSAFSTWLHRVAVNTVLMHFRRKGRRQESLEHPHPQNPSGRRPEYGRVDQRLAACADRLALTRAIGALPPGYRTIFVLHEMQGYEHQEIARRLHCSIGNSKSQLHKAKSRMREVLAAHGYTYRKRLTTANRTTLRASVVADTAAIKSVPPTDSLSWFSNQLPGIAKEECKNYQPSLLEALLHRSEVQGFGRSKHLTDALIEGDSENVLPAIAQGSTSLMADSST